MFFEIPKKKKHRFILPVVLAAVLAVAILAGAVILVPERSPVDSRKDILLAVEGLDNNTLLFVNSDGEAKKIDDITPISTIVSWSAFLTNHERRIYRNGIIFSGDRSRAVYTRGSDSTLYYIDTKLESVKIKDGVSVVRVGLTGDYIIYETGEAPYTHCNLYIYDVEKAESTKVDSDVNAGMVCISPGGSSVAYVKTGEDVYNSDMYLYTAGEESVRVGRDKCFPIAVSDDGKTLFYYDMSKDVRDLKYYDGESSERIASDVYDTGYTNKEVSELLFYKDGKTYYFNTKQGEPQRVCSNYLERRTNHYNGSYEDYNLDHVICTRNTFSGICNLDSLTDTFYSIEYADFSDYQKIGKHKIAWLGADGLDTEKVTSEWNDYYIVSEDGGTLLYLRQGDWYRAKNLAGDVETGRLNGKLDVKRVIHSRDLSHIYLVTKDGPVEVYQYSTRRVEQRRVEQDESALAEVDMAVRLACSFAKVYAEIPEKGCIVEIAGDGTVPTSGIEKLDAELATAIPNGVTFTSQKYKDTTQTITITLNDTGGIITVADSWSEN